VLDLHVGSARAGAPHVLRREIPIVGEGAELVRHRVGRADDALIGEDGLLADILDLRSRSTDARPDIGREARAGVEIIQDVDHRAGGLDVPRTTLRAVFPVVAAIACLELDPRPAEGITGGDGSTPAGSGVDLAV